jgi:light-regulated signal transduction histidine kinase (bacteriophytochrome)
LRYAAAAAAVAATLLARVWLMNALGVSLPYIAFFPAILLIAAAWIIQSLHAATRRAEASAALSAGRLRESEERFRTIEDALRRSNEDLKEFAYAASHDLQQPLRTISVYSQVLQANYRRQLDERAGQFLTGIVNGAGAMSGLVRGLLAFVEAGDDDSALELVDCGEALQAAVAHFRELIAETGAVITSAALPPVYAQRHRIVELFENVIGNALKYRSAAPPRIYVDASRQGADWVLSVRDNGIGIDPKYHARIFGLFKRLYGDEYPGAGAGLAICSRIVERYGGRIWVESERGKGSTFYFTLPAGEREKQ